MCPRRERPLSSVVIGLSVLIAACGRLGFDAAAGDGGAAPIDTGAGPFDGTPGLDAATGDGSPPGDASGLDARMRDAQTGDASVPGDGGTGSDAGAGDAGAPCESFGPWSTPVAISELNTGWDDDEPTLGDDGRMIIFVSNRPGSAGYDLYVATRPTIDDPFGAPELMPMLNGSAHESSPALAGDDRTLFFVSDRTGIRRFYVGDRVSGSVMLAPGLEGESGGVGLEISWDALEVFFTDWTGDGQELYRAERASVSDPFGAPALITELNTAADEAHPTISADGLTLWFDSDADGAYRIHETTRPARGAAFSAASPVIELDHAENTAYADVSDDGRIMVLSSQRLTGGGAWDLFESRRDCL